MPIYDYHCQACGHAFEALVRGDHPPTCPRCATAAPTKVVSRLASVGRIEAIRMAHRRVAASQGLFDNYSPSDKAKLLQGKKGI